MKMSLPVSANIGAIGKISFRRGYYIYCGSGRRNLSQRLSRHMTRRKKLRWHIDYLTCRDDVCVESARVLPPDGITECELNSLVQRLSGAEPIPGFGCSDCRCISHLSFLGDELPDLWLQPHFPHGRS